MQDYDFDNKSRSVKSFNHITKRVSIDFLCWLCCEKARSLTCWTRASVQNKRSLNVRFGTTIPSGLRWNFTHVLCAQISFWVHISVRSLHKTHINYHPSVRTRSIFHVYSTSYGSFTFGSQRTVSATDATEDDIQIHSCGPCFSAGSADFVWHYNQLWKVLFTPREKRHTQGRERDQTILSQ